MKLDLSENMDIVITSGESMPEWWSRFERDYRMALRVIQGWECNKINWRYGVTIRTCQNNVASLFKKVFGQTEESLLNRSSVSCIRKVLATKNTKNGMTTDEMLAFFHKECRNLITVRLKEHKLLNEYNGWKSVSSWKNGKVFYCHIVDRDSLFDLDSALSLAQMRKKFSSGSNYDNVKSNLSMATELFLAEVALNKLRSQGVNIPERADELAKLEQHARTLKWALGLIKVPLLTFA